MKISIIFQFLAIFQSSCTNSRNSELKANMMPLPNQEQSLALRCDRVMPNGNRVRTVIHRTIPNGHIVQKVILPTNGIQEIYRPHEKYDTPVTHTIHEEYRPLESVSFHTEASMEDIIKNDPDKVCEKESLHQALVLNSIYLTHEPKVIIPQKFSAIATSTSRNIQYLSFSKTGLDIKGKTYTLEGHFKGDYINPDDKRNPQEVLKNLAIGSPVYGVLAPAFKQGEKIVTNVTPMGETPQSFYGWVQDIEFLCDRVKLKVVAPSWLP